MEPILSVSNLSHRYTSQWALSDVSWSLTRPGVYGLLGVNGAGKSTLMNIVCGVITQRSGSVEVCGADTVAEPDRAKGGLGFLPQQAPLHDELNVREYLGHAARLRGLSGSVLAHSVDEVIARCRLGGVQSRLLGNLSGGYRQRVGLAQAIVHDPTLVVLDEPTNGLDPNQMVPVRELIREIGLSSVVVLSTHILSEVEEMCSELLMLHEGKVVFEGQIAEFVGHVESEAVDVRFDGEIETNVLHALNDVTGIEDLGNGKYRIFSDRPARTTDALISASMAQSWHVRELQPKRPSLSDAFGQLSRIDDAVQSTRTAGIQGTDLRDE